MDVRISGLGNLVVPNSLPIAIAYCILNLLQRSRPVVHSLKMHAQIFSGFKNPVDG
jgi:hypothetical protein